MTTFNMKLLAGKAAQKQKLEWHVCEDEHEWEAIQGLVESSQGVAMLSVTPTRQLWLRRHLYIVVAMLLVLALGGWGIWRHAEAGIAQVETELEAEIAAELQHDDLPAAPAPQPDAQHAPATAAQLPREAGEVISQVEIRDLGASWAVVDVTLQPTAGGQSYRQTRVYQENAQGWVREDATAARWGAARQLESQYFVFAYHAVDEAAVRAAAAQLDARYPDLQKYAERDTALGETRVVTYEAYLIQNKLYGDEWAAPARASVPTATSQKWRITVDPEQRPGVFYQEDTPSAELVVASPTAMLLPAETAPGDVLVQALMIALYDRQALDSFSFGSLPGHWYRVNNATRLWIIWEQELPLAIWRKPLVQWVLNDSPDAPDRGAYRAPDFAHELCEHHELWMRSPLEVAVPILCWHRSDGQSMTSSWRYGYAIYDYSLEALLYAYAAKLENHGVYQDLLLSEPGPYAIVLATALEYVATTYGAEEVPRLLSAIPAHSTAATLIPATLGVSPAEFEEGWRAFVIERYALGE